MGTMASQVVYPSGSSVTRRNYDSKKDKRQLERFNYINAMNEPGAVPLRYNHKYSVSDGSVVMDHISSDVGS